MRVDGQGWSFPAEMQAVPFPVTSAEEAKAVCDRVASLLQDHLEARPDLVAMARDGWEGAYRHEFDEVWGRQSRRLSDLKDDLRRLAGRIDDALANAETINEQRAEQRSEYLAETGLVGPNVVV